MMTMDPVAESDFEHLAGKVLSELERAIEASGLSVDVETLEGGILQLEFAEGTPMIINRHLAAREIWVAARTGGHHFSLSDGAWRDTRSGEELFAAIERLLSDRCGQPVSLRA